MKHLIIIGGWFCSTLITLFVGISTIHFAKNTRQIDYQLPPLTDHSILSSRPPQSSILGISSHITSADARPLLVSQFLKKYHSPLTPHDYWGQYLVQLADKYQFDFRLLPAIAMQESNLCKKIPENTYNCLGLGIHSQGTWAFDSFEANFDKAASILKKNYIDQGLVTPEQIQTKYTPHSNGSWQFAVNQFMARIDQAR